jgi:hypothetical protein
MTPRRLFFGTHYLWQLTVSKGRVAFDTFRQRCKEVEDIREARGMALLREWLSPEQRAQLDASRSFDVVGCHTGKRYRIRLGSRTNVYEIDQDGRPIIGWCFAPSENLVRGDVMLAQKIALEADENAALAVANKFPVPISHQ